MNKKRAFTLTELVVTIGILAIAFALTAGLIVTMNSVQDSNANEANKSQELIDFNESVSSYISFLSIETDEISFTYDSVNSTSTKIVFNYSTYHFDLKFTNSTLAMISNYTGDNAYFKKTFQHSFNFISAISFEYTESIGQLVSDVTISGSVIQYTHTLRTAS